MPANFAITLAQRISVLHEEYEKARNMTRHFGVLILSTNTTVETELARLPSGYQVHFARLMI